MQGARIRGTQMHGADVSKVKMQATSIYRSVIYRVKSRETETNEFFSDEISAKKILYTDYGHRKLGNYEISNWVNDIVGKYYQFDYTGRIHCILQLNSTDLMLDEATESEWQLRAFRSHVGDSLGLGRRATLMRILADLVCAGEWAPQVARRLTMPSLGEVEVYFSSSTSSQLSRLNEHLDAVRDRMKAGRADPAKCPGVVGFTEADWRRLDEIEPRPD